MKIMDILVNDAVILDLGAGSQARGARRDGRLRWPRPSPRSRPIACWRCSWSARRSRAPGSGRASRSPMGRWLASTAWWLPSPAARDGVDFDSIDGQPTQHLFLLVVPEHSGGQYLKALARISRFFRDAAFRQQLTRTPTTRRAPSSARSPKRTPSSRGLDQRSGHPTTQKLCRRPAQLGPSNGAGRGRADRGHAVHGALLEVHGVGIVLMLGPSGVGKSECALELLRRGHRLVADDVDRAGAGDRRAISLARGMRRPSGSATTWRCGVSESLFVAGPVRRRIGTRGIAVVDSGLPAGEVARGRRLRARRESSGRSEESIAGVEIPRLTAAGAARR